MTASTRAAIERVLALHRSSYGWCRHCHNLWPCETRIELQTLPDEMGAVAYKHTLLTRLVAWLHPDTEPDPRSAAAIERDIGADALTLLRSICAEGEDR